MRNLLVVTVVVAVTAAFGCASKGNNAEYFKQVQYEQERQRIKAAADDAEKKRATLAQKTADDYESSGDIAWKEGNNSLAIMSYHNCLGLDPARFMVHYKIGRIYLTKNLADDARREFEQVIQKDPENPRVCEDMGKAHFIARDFDKAAEMFQRVLSREPGNWRVHNLIGVILDRRGNHKGAITHYETAIALRPESGALFNNLGVAYLMDGDYQRAARAFQEACRREPVAKSYNNLGLALGKMGKYQEAFKAFSRAGGEPAALNNMGYLHYSDEHYEDAVKDFQKAFEASPKFYSRAYDNLNKAKSLAASLAEERK